MKIRDLFKSIETLNKLNNDLNIGDSQKIVVVKINLNTYVFTTFKQLNSYLKREYFDDYIEEFYKQELIQDKNYLNEFDYTIPYHQYSDNVLIRILNENEF